MERLYHNCKKENCNNYIFSENATEWTLEQKMHKVERLTWITPTTLSCVLQTQ